MFIRVKQNKGGTSSVVLIMNIRVPGKKNPVSRVIKNFGASANPDEILAFTKNAQDYKLKLESRNLSLKPLTISAATDIHSCKSITRGFSDIYGQMFNSTFLNLNLRPKHFSILRDLTIMRIAEPASKRKTAAVAETFGLDLKLDNIYKMMDHLDDLLIEQTKHIIYKKTQSLLASKSKPGSVDVLFYDLTTIYFETNSQDIVRDFGFSKDGKHRHVQVMLAMIVTHDGLPIGYEIFPGNTHEGHTLIPVLTKMRDKYEIRNVVLVADSALMNNINLNELEELNFKYVISARIKNINKEIKDLILDNRDYNITHEATNKDGEVVDLITSKVIDLDEKKKNTISNDDESGVSLDVGILADGNETKSSGCNKLICYHSTLRARKDLNDRLENIEKIEKHLGTTAKSKLTGILKKSYVKVTQGSKIELDESKIKLAEKFDGFFGIRTNIDDATPAELLGYYKGLWQIEQSFRIAKNNLEIRPVFHWSVKRIKAHFAICYIALSILRFVEFNLKLSGKYLPLEVLHTDLMKMKVVNITTNEGQSYHILEDPPLNLIPIYQSLGIKWPKRFRHIE